MKFDEMRFKAKLTYQEVGDLTTINKTNLCLYEKGVRQITTHHLQLLSSFYNASPKFLTNESDSFIIVSNVLLTDSEFRSLLKQGKITKEIVKRENVDTLNNVIQETPYYIEWQFTDSELAKDYQFDLDVSQLSDYSKAKVYEFIKIHDLK